VQQKIADEGGFAEFLQSVHGVNHTPSVMLNT
jgi:hypothetical protein